jgi:hypothetical protein
MDEDILDDVYNTLNGFEYIPYELDYKCFPNLEIGDVVTIEQSVGSSWLETTKTWGNADFAWNHDIISFNVIVLYNKITYKGGLRSTLKADSESQQTSEFKVKGSLRQYIENIDKNTIKEGKVYNGVTTSREEGVVVERSDGKAKTIMNATEGISIYSDLGYGLAKNFFVGLDGRIQAKGIDIDGSGTFSGELNAAGGTFSGDLVAAGGTFSGELNAAGGTFSGDLVAAGGTFSGTISANQIRGGTLSGITLNIDTNAVVGDSIRLGSTSNNLTLERVSGGMYMKLTGQTLMRFFGNDLWVDGNLCLEPGAMLGVFTSGISGSYYTGLMQLSNNEIKLSPQTPNAVVRLNVNNQEIINVGDLISAYDNVTLRAGASGNYNINLNCNDLNLSNASRIYSSGNINVVTGSGADIALTCDDLILSNTNRVYSANLLNIYSNYGVNLQSVNYNRDINITSNGGINLSAGGYYGIKLSGYLGFFNKTPVAKTVITNITTSATPEQVRSKLIELITALQSYGLV